MMGPAADRGSSNRSWKPGCSLEINREKTRVVDLREEGASLDFLGYTFRYDRDRQGRERNVTGM